MMRDSMRNANPVAPATAEELAAMRRAAWHKQHILVIPMSEGLIDDWTYKMLTNLGNGLYGARKADNAPP